MCASSAFERLRRKYDRTESRCTACGYRNEQGGWRVTTAGSRMQYQHTCPACGATDSREVHLGRR